MAKVMTALANAQRGGETGYSLMQKTKLPSGTVYPMLLRMEKNGWVKSRWESESSKKKSGPRRRFYELTGIGQTVFRGVIGEADDLIASATKATV